MSEWNKEYLRRNLIHAASIGMKGNAEYALRRLSSHQAPPLWLLNTLAEIVERGEKVCPELAAHRNEVRMMDSKDE